MANLDNRLPTRHTQVQRSTIGYGEKLQLHEECSGLHMRVLDVVETVFHGLAKKLLEADIAISSTVASLGLLRIAKTRIHQACIAHCP